MEEIKRGVKKVNNHVHWVWAIFSTEAAESKVGRKADPEDPEDPEFAEKLTGWCPVDPSCPGDIFQDEPYIRVYGRKLIVKQRRGVVQPLFPENMP